MKTTKALKVLAGLALLSSVYPASADIDVLWYTGGAEWSGPGSYASFVGSLEAQEENPLFNTATVNNWNVTLWSGGAMPAGAFDVLVVASDVGGQAVYPDYTSLFSSVTEASFGDRVFLTGQDADWHYVNGPGSSSFDGPAGFLIDAINWAGSGTGMGGVMLSTFISSSIFSGVTDGGPGSDTVIIPGPMASFPVNEDLTSAGLSGWSTSSHESFVITDADKWLAINIGGSGQNVTIVSKDTAGGGTGEVPEPSTVIGGIALAGLVLARKLRK